MSEAYFFDSSALVKRFVQETGTTWIFNLFKPSSANSIFIARITSVEVISALTRRMRNGTLPPQNFNKATIRLERSLQYRYAFVEIQEQIVTTALQLAIRHGLRGYDAIQLAAALKIHQARQQNGLSPLNLVSADDELNNAALAEGIIVENPNNHP